MLHRSAIKETNFPLEMQLFLYSCSAVPKYHKKRRDGGVSENTVLLYPALFAEARFLFLQQHLVEFTQRSFHVERHLTVLAIVQLITSAHLGQPVNPHLDASVAFVTLGQHC